MQSAKTKLTITLAAIVALGGFVLLLHIVSSKNTNGSTVPRSSIWDSEMGLLGNANSIILLLSDESASNRSLAVSHIYRKGRFASDEWLRILNACSSGPALSSSDEISLRKRTERGERDFWVAASKWCRATRTSLGPGNLKWSNAEPLSLIQTINWIRHSVDMDDVPATDSDVRAVLDETASAVESKIVLGG